MIILKSFISQSGLWHLEIISHLSDNKLFSLPFQASFSNNFPLLLFFFCFAFTHTISLSHFSPNESDPIVNSGLEMMCSLCKKWVTSLLFQLAELTHFPGLHMLDLVMPQARLSQGRGKGGAQCQCTGATRHTASQKAPWTGGREHRSVELRPVAQLTFSPPVSSAYKKAPSLSAPHGSVHCSTLRWAAQTALASLLGHLVMGKDSLTRAWHPFWSQS